MHAFHLAQHLLALLLTLRLALRHLLHGLRHLLHRLGRLLLGLGGLLERLFLRLVQIRCVLDRLLQRFGILRQIGIESGVLQRILEVLPLVGGFLQLPCEILQRGLQGFRLLGRHVAGLHALRETLERLLRLLEVPLRERLREFVRVSVTGTVVLQVRKRLPKGRVHPGILALEDLLQTILQRRHLADGLPLHLFGSPRLFGLVAILQATQHFLQRAFHLRREHLVLVDDRDQFLDLGLHLLVGLREHGVVLRRHASEEIPLRHDRPDPDHEEEKHRRDPPATRRRRTERLCDPAPDVGALRGGRGIRDRRDGEGIVPIRNLDGRAQSIVEAQPLVDRDGDRHGIPTGTEGPRECEQQDQASRHGRRDPPWRRQRWNGLRRERPQHQHGETDHGPPGERLEKAGQGQPAGGASDKALDLGHRRWVPRRRIG